LPSDLEFGNLSTLTASFHFLPILFTEGGSQTLPLGHKLAQGGYVGKPVSAVDLRTLALEFGSSL
jgi:hypothetical protein